MCNSGCLMVSASGNFPGSNDRGRILTVGALDENGDGVTKYAIGQTMAGGLQVAGYLTGAGVSRAGDSCAQGLKLVDGTSFSTPLMSAIAGKLDAGGPERGHAEVTPE